MLSVPCPNNLLQCYPAGLVSIRSSLMPYLTNLFLDFSLIMWFSQFVKFIGTKKFGRCLLLRSSWSIAILRQQQKNIRALASMSWVYDITYKIFQTHGKEKLISIVKLIDMYLSHFSPVVNACCILESCSAYHLKTEQYFEGLTVTFQIRFRYLLSSYVRMVPLFSQDISLHLRILWLSNRNRSLWVCLTIFFFPEE